MVCLALELVGPCVVLGFSVGMDWELEYKKAECQKLILLNCGVGEDS